MLESFSLDVKPGERIALIGPNGCGKSTLLRTVTAEIPKSSGTVRFNGEDITDLETDQIVGRGIGYLRQTRNIFPGLTVGENLELATINCGNRSAWSLDGVLQAFPILQGRTLVRAGLARRQAS